MSEITNKATQPLAALREILETARTTEQPARVHAMMIDVLDGLITHAEKQARMLDSVRSDLDHKQGIVTRIGGGDYAGPAASLAPEKADELDL